MANEIVVGYDGTDCGHAALDLACELAEGLGSKVIVAYGFQPYQGAGEIGTQRELMRDQGRIFVDEGVATAKERGVDAEAALIPERPAAALANLAEKLEARMIIVGTYGESPIKGAILGSTPHKLVHMATVPVVVTPAGQRDDD